MSYNEHYQKCLVAATKCPGTVQHKISFYHKNRRKPRTVARNDPQSTHLGHDGHNSNSDSTFDTMGNMTVTVTGTGSDTGLAVAGWYFGVHDGSDIMTNVEINDKNTFDINKLGK